MWSRSRWWPATLAGQFLVLQLTVLLAVVAVASVVSVQQSDADFRDTRGARLRAAAEDMANTEPVRDPFVDGTVADRRVSLISYTQRVRNNLQASGVYLADPDGVVLVSSDFVVEGGGSRSYVRFTPALGADMAGAPILDQEGRVVGIAGIGSDTNAALPAAIAAPVVSALLRSGAPAPDRAGMEVSDITPAVAARLGDPRQRGAFVSLIAGGSPADQAGLMAGDVVIAAAGSPIASASELARALDGASGATSLDVVRRGTAITITLKLSPRTE